VYPRASPGWQGTRGRGRGRRRARELGLPRGTPGEDPEGDSRGEEARPTTKRVQQDPLELLCHRAGAPAGLPLPLPPSLPLLPERAASEGSDFTGGAPLLGLLCLLLLRRLL